MLKKDLEYNNLEEFCTSLNDEIEEMKSVIKDFEKQSRHLT